MQFADLQRIFCKMAMNNLQLGLFITGAAIAGILLGIWLYSINQRRKRRAEESKSNHLPTTLSSKSPVPAASSTNIARSNPSHPYSNTDLQKGISTYFGAHIFSYEELEEATNNFDPSKEIGKGGFGKVYHGKLHDGSVVAVKRLHENNMKRVEQFMNEVEILTKIRHQNLVALYGCTSQRSKELILVYEYVSNGTVADHLHGNRSKSGLLTWPVRLSIAIESAEALAYLHVSDVIHRDVKTNNILLDENFQVKVADFAVDMNRHRQDINLVNMAVNKNQNHALHELVDPLLGFEKDYTVKKMTTSVAELAFRCLEKERDTRPSMDEVLEILKGIQNGNEEMGAQKAEVMDIKAADDVNLLKNIPPPLSLDSVVTDKWVNSPTAPNSS
ncbi:hypothetical protein CMV_002863 [Castanea mollissima]|uniref:Protein kinase domain-containing protein n=1 Tax=Castanea mollissima TaxID=60419 RepID=A0A8J4RV73_9ROSI|nr:hypothetical protein CMV_002863 [Castanea mollissima]